MFAGLQADSYVLVNTSRTVSELDIDALVDRVPREHVLTVAASDLAREHLGRPLPNAVLLGAFAAMTGQLRIESVELAIRAKFSGAVADGNCAAARAAYDGIRHEIEGLAHAAAD